MLTEKSVSSLSPISFSNARRPVSFFSFFLLESVVEMVDERRKAAVTAASVVFLALLLPGAAQSTKYRKGDQVPLFANKVHCAS